MAEFDTRFASGSRSRLLARFGSSVTYTPPGGAGVATTAIRFNRPNTDDYRVRVYGLSAEDVAAPVRQATITDGADVWRVVEVEDDVGGLWPVTCELDRLHSNAEGA